jgi:hypothetical protein
MSYIPRYLRGELACIENERHGQFGLKDENPDYQVFLKWLVTKNKTLETWLSENPEPPKPEPTKEEQVKAAETKLQSENYALVKMVVELREKLAVATGLKFDPVPTELAAKLAAVEALKTAEAVQP